MTKYEGGKYDHNKRGFLKIWPQHEGGNMTTIRGGKNDHNKREFLKIWPQYEFF